MTTLNYSINGLKDLLNDLDNLSTCLMSIPQEHVDCSVIAQLRHDQYELIQKVNTYALVVLHTTEDASFCKSEPVT